MKLKLPIPIRNLLKATSFWREHHLILREIKHFRKIAVLAVAFALMGAAFEGSTVGLIASFLQGLTNPNEPPIQTGIHWFDVWFMATEAPASERIYRLSALILIVIWLRSSFLYLGSLYSKLAEFNLTHYLRKSIFEQLQSLSLSYYSKTRSGELINSLSGEVNRVQRAFNIISIYLIKGSTLFAYVISMFLLSWQLSITSFMMLSLLSVGLSNITARAREAGFEVPKANSQFSSVSLEFINGIRTVHASATQAFERKRFYRATQQVLKATSKVAKFTILVQPLVQGIASTILIGLVAVAFNVYIANGQLRAASVLAFLFALTRTSPIVSELNMARTNFSSLQGALHNVSDLLRRDNKPYLTDGSVQFSGLKQSIDFVSVNFGYEVDEPILHEITLSIKQGETTALVGSSGAGKTTLADLIPRFYDPSLGKILIDGIDLREFEINTLRRRMAIVSQDTFIFNASVSDNIAYGIEAVDQDAVREVARQANALDFILKLPGGFDAELGDRGVRLSGGQRQRIAIARALLRNPEILILDEATSALDSVTERLIQESLERLSKGRTVIAIAHRLSTIVRADRVVVLEQGRIIEQGKYQALLEQRGKLWKYHQMQHELGQVG